MALTHRHIFTEGHQYRRTDGLVGTGLMPYKAHCPKYQHLHVVSGSSLLEIGDLKQFIESHVTQHSDNEFHLSTILLINANFLISSLDLLNNFFTSMF